MLITKNVEVTKKVLLIAVALGLVFFASTIQFANAEEDTDDEATTEVVTGSADTEEESDDSVAAKKAAMRAQIESLRKMIEERKAQLGEKRETMKEEKKEAIEEWKAKQAADRAAFMTSLEGMTLEERKRRCLSTSLRYGLLLRLRKLK